MGFRVDSSTLKLLRLPTPKAEAVLDGEIDSFTDVAQSSGPFTYFHKGSLAYLGGLGLLGLWV